MSFESVIRLHNISRTQFHIAPISIFASDVKSAIIFNLNEAKEIDLTKVDFERFIDSIEKGKLKILTKFEYDKILEENKLFQEEEIKYISNIKKIKINRIEDFGYHYKPESNIVTKLKNINFTDYQTNPDYDINWTGFIEQKVEENNDIIEKEDLSLFLKIWDENEPLTEEIKFLRKIVPKREWDRIKK